MSTSGERTRAGRRPPARTAPGPASPRGWVAIATRVRVALRRDHVSLVAAGVAFYTMLALVPTLIALVTVYGLVADPDDVERQVAPLVESLPGGVGALLQGQLEAITGAPQASLGVGLAASLVAALWAASSGMQGLIGAITIAYDQPETRGFARLRGLALALTLGGVVFGALAVGLVAVLPVALEALGLADVAALSLRVLRWPILAVLVIGAFTTVYRLAPSHDPPRWRAASVGAVIATALWLAGSALFSLYVTNFGTYNETYGSLGAVIALLLWLLLTSVAVVVGAEINAELERQAQRAGEGAATDR